MMNYKKIILGDFVYIFDPSDLEIIKVMDQAYIKEVCKNIARKKKGKYVVKKRDEVCNSNEDIDIVSLDLAHGCTLKCTYCYLTAGDRLIKKLTKDTFLQILHFLSEKKKHKITFYFAGGGEPTLNFELLKQIPTLCREQGFEDCVFEITTNGTLLTQEILNFFVKEKFSVSVSLDGDEVNDKNRIFPNGESSFNFVFDKIKQIKQSKIYRFACKAVVMPDNKNLLQMCDFFEINKIPFYLGFATRSFNGIYVPNVGDVRNLKEQMNLVIDYYAKKIIENQYIYSRKIMDDLQRIHYRITTVEGCDAARKSFYIDMDGDIYSCSCHNSKKELSVGNIQTGIDYEKIKRNSYYPKNVNEYVSCKHCWIRYLCSGSCIAVKWLESKDTNIPCRYLCAVNNVYWEAIIKLYICIYDYIDGNINFVETPFRKRYSVHDV